MSNSKEKADKAIDKCLDTRHRVANHSSQVAIAIGEAVLVLAMAGKPVTVEEIIAHLQAEAGSRQGEHNPLRLRNSCAETALREALSRSTG